MVEAGPDAVGVAAGELEPCPAHPGKMRQPSAATTNRATHVLLRRVGLVIRPVIAVAAAENQFGPQLAELEKASTSLNATIEGLPSQGNGSTNLGEITPSVTAVEQAAKPIMDS